MSSVDVIVPCYNYGHFLSQCIGSALSQPVTCLRVLIIDDASTDRSLETAHALAASDRRVHVISHPRNRGHIFTYNEGIEWVQGKYMLLLSADDYLSPGALGRAISVLERHESISFVHGRFLEFVEENGRIRPARFEGGRYLPCSDEFSAAQLDSGQDAYEFEIIKGEDFIRQRCLKPGNPVGTATAVVRSDLQKRVGGYREELPHSGDFEMWLRLAANGSVGKIQTVQAFMRIHERNMRHQYFNNKMLGDFKQRHKTLEMFFAYASDLLPNSAELSQLAHRCLAEEAIWHASTRIEEGALDGADELLQLARAASADIVYSGAWWKLRAKRFIGPKNWRALSPLVSRFRQSG